MFRTRIVCLALAAVLVLGLSAGASAAQVDCDEVYCFTAGDFAGEEPLTGICITATPASGTVALGSRIVRAGDILTAAQLEKLTFSPLRTKNDLQASISYLPIYQNRVDREAVTTISIHGKTDKAPVAQDSSLETYKNLENEGRLKVTDPEGGKLVFTLVRQPKRGTVELREDGSFLYTPKKNKVGVDSFTYTAADEGGNVSREATVTIKIFKPSDRKQYADTTASSCRFAAEWMRSTGIFEGEQVGDALCFNPQKAVTRGEFLAMVMDTLDIAPQEEAEKTGFADDAPFWLRPYLAAALQQGIVCGYPEESGPVFKAAQPITGAEAAVVLKNALKLPLPASALDENLPAWAAGALGSVHDQGISLENSRTVTRAEAANILYQVSKLSTEVPEV